MHSFCVVAHGTDTAGVTPIKRAAGDNRGGRHDRKGCGQGAFPLATYLRTILIDLTSVDLDYADENSKAAQIFIGMVPILLVYPFLAGSGQGMMPPLRVPA